MPLFNRAVATDLATVPAADGATAVVGVSLSAAPADHAHPRYHWAPVDHGYLAQSVDVALTGASGTVLATGGTLYIARIHVPVAISCTNVIIGVSAAGSVLTSGQCFVALYNAAGTRIGVSADQAAAWASAGVKVAALASGPFSLTAGDHYGAIWFNGTTGPTLARSAALTAAITNAGLSAPNFRAASADTGLTTTAPPSLGAQTSLGSLFWFALS